MIHCFDSLKVIEGSFIELLWSSISAGNHCVEYVSILHPIVAILPAYFRFAQCIRRYRDTKEASPHLVNAAKYATSFFVVIFAHKFHTTTGK